MPMYSHSRLSVYETCPRKYRFQHVERVKVPEAKTAEMFLGSRVHDTLESLCRRGEGGDVPRSTTCWRTTALAGARALR